MTLRGFVACNQWPESDGTHPRASDAREDNDSSGSSNPLKAFFDARTEGKGIWKWCHYFDIYHHHLSRFIGREVHVLEIGVHSGGSLEMWKHYFGPKCTVYGVDREVACKVYEDDRTKIFAGDQEDRTFWRQFKEQVPVVDIVIDDGSHLPEQQVVTLQEMLPHLSAGGVYICEDVHTVSNRFAAYVYGLGDQLNAFNLVSQGTLDCRPTRFQNAIHSIHLYPYVIIIERTARPAGRFVCERHGTEWQPF